MSDIIITKHTLTKLYIERLFGINPEWFSPQVTDVVISITFVYTANRFTVSSLDNKDVIFLLYDNYLDVKPTSIYYSCTYSAETKNPYIDSILKELLFS